MKRTRAATVPQQFDVAVLTRCCTYGGVGSEDAPQVSPETRNGRASFSLGATLASRLSEGYARSHKKSVIVTLIDAARGKEAPYPATLAGPCGTVIDMVTVVVHTGAHFLARADLCSSEGRSSERSMCPPNADRRAKDRFHSEAAAAIVEIMNGAAPAALPLKVIGGLLEFAQHFEARFVATLLPHYLRPLATQLNAQQASELLVKWLPSAHGAEATHAYKELVQVLAPCIAGDRVSHEHFAAAALHIITGAQRLCDSNNGHAVEALTMYERLLEIAGGLAEFRPVVSLAAGSTSDNIGASAGAQHADGAERTDADQLGEHALLCLVFAVAACCVCDGCCTDQRDNNAPSSMADRASTSRGRGSRKRARLSPDFESPVQTLQRCFARCSVYLHSADGTTSALAKRAAAATKLLMRGSTHCSCRDAALEAALDRRSLLEHVAADSGNQTMLIDRSISNSSTGDAKRVVLACKLEIRADVGQCTAFAAHPLSLQSDWCFAAFRSEGKHRCTCLGLENTARHTKRVTRYEILALSASAELKSVTRASRKWCCSADDGTGGMSDALSESDACGAVVLGEGEDEVKANKAWGHPMSVLRARLKKSRLQPSASMAAGSSVIICAAFETNSA